MVPWKSTGEKVSFEWISSTDSKVRTTLHVSIMDSGGGGGGGRVKGNSITIKYKSQVVLV